MSRSHRSNLALVSFAGIAALASPAFAAKFQVVHDFTGGVDGAVPGYTLAADGRGNFIGAAHDGGNGAGVVFKLSNKNSEWSVKPLYNFKDTDGQPGWGVTLVGDVIYTNAGYASVMGGPCGSAIRLGGKSGAARGKSEDLMHTYVKSQDGCPTGNLIVDSSGNVFGVTQDGGANGWGSIFELTPSGSGWTETILYSFTGSDDGGAPYSELVMDDAGNLYGTASACASACSGTAFELKRTKAGWTYQVLHSFTGGADGGQPVAAMIFDPEGNLYGATTSFGPKGGGTVFELSPSSNSWNFTTLVGMTGSDGPVASLALNTVGNLYGTNFMDGVYGYGSVFSVTHTAKGWKYRTLHDFTGGADGGYPGGGIALDKHGNLFGTAVLGGANSQGVIYEVKP